MITAYKQLISDFFLIIIEFAFNYLFFIEQNTAFNGSLAVVTTALQHQYDRIIHLHYGLPKASKAIPTVYYLQAFSSLN